MTYLRRFLNPSDERLTKWHEVSQQQAEYAARLHFPRHDWGNIGKYYQDGMIVHGVRAIYRKVHDEVAERLMVLV